MLSLRCAEYICKALQYMMVVRHRSWAMEKTRIDTHVELCRRPTKEASRLVLGADVRFCTWKLRGHIVYDRVEELFCITATGARQV